MLESETVLKREPYPIHDRSRKRQVLVVDDNEVVRDALSRMLSFLGYDVTPAGNGLEGGTVFLLGSYDLVVTDLHMPLMNGWELSRFVKERSPKTPVIVVTGLLREKPQEESEINQVDAVISKPFRLEEIERTLQNLLK